MGTDPGPGGHRPETVKHESVVMSDMMCLLCALATLAGFAFGPWLSAVSQSSQPVSFTTRFRLSRPRCRATLHS